MDGLERLGVARDHRFPERFASPSAVRLATGAEARRADTLVQVDDDGAGIDPALLRAVFEPFVQAERSLRRTDGGLGLGLTLVKGVIELHGGNGNISSRGVGAGCSVVIRLPLQLDADAAEVVVAPALLTSTKTRLRVLLVDDNADMTEMLAEWLESSGHETASATDGMAALELAGRFSPDLALIDIGLPELDGYEVAKRLRTGLPSGVVLIAMSGYGSEEDRERSRGAGFDEHGFSAPRSSYTRQNRAPVPPFGSRRSLLRVVVTSSPSSPPHLATASSLPPQPTESAGTTRPMVIAVRMNAFTCPITRGSA
jgi:CheY-like chemotaxis protein